MAIKGAGGKMRAQEGTPYATGVAEPNGGQTVMETFPMRTKRRQGRQESIDLRDERGMTSGTRERSTTISGTT